MLRRAKREGAHGVMLDLSTNGGGALDASAFFGQDTNALERMASDFGTTVVTSILEAF